MVYRQPSLPAKASSGVKPENGQADLPERQELGGAWVHGKITYSVVIGIAVEETSKAKSECGSEGKLHCRLRSSHQTNDQHDQPQRPRYHCHNGAAKKPRGKIGAALSSSALLEICRLQRHGVKMIESADVTSSGSAGSARARSPPITTTNQRGRKWQGRGEEEQRKTAAHMQARRRQACGGLRARQRQRRRRVQ